MALSHFIYLQWVTKAFSRPKIILAYYTLNKCYLSFHLSLVSQLLLEVDRTFWLCHTQRSEVIIRLSIVNSTTPSSMRYWVLERMRVSNLCAIVAHTTNFTEMNSNACGVTGFIHAGFIHKDKNSKC